MDLFTILGLSALILGMVLVRLVAGVCDRRRIEAHATAQGGRIVGLRWAPFGCGWYRTNGRIYEVRYHDRNGDRHHARCKTGLFSGVRWTHDHLVCRGGRVPKRDSTVILLAESRRLRAERHQRRDGAV